jgi:hypothetical protein
LLSPVKDSDNTLDEGQNMSSSESALESERKDELYYDDYLRRLENLNILRERYEELIHEKEKLEAELERRQELWIELDAEDIDFLAHFGETIGRVRIMIMMMIMIIIFVLWDLPKGIRTC